MFNTILPFLQEHREGLLWRVGAFKIALAIAALRHDGGNLTKEGYKSIVNLLYSVPNKYGKPRNYWLGLIEKRVWK